MRRASETWVANGLVTRGAGQIGPANQIGASASRRGGPMSRTENSSRERCKLLVDCTDDPSSSCHNTPVHRRRLARGFCISDASSIQTTFLRRRLSETLTPRNLNASSYSPSPVNRTKKAGERQAINLPLSGKEVDYEPFTEGRRYPSGNLKIARRETPAMPCKGQTTLIRAEILARRCCDPGSPAASD